jgi:hypothetical protein
MVSKKKSPAKKSAPVKKAAAAKKVAPAKAAAKKAAPAKKAARPAGRARSSPANAVAKELPYKLDEAGGKLMICPAKGGACVDPETIADIDGATLTLVVKLRDPSAPGAANGGMLDALNAFLKKRAAAVIAADVTTTIPVPPGPTPAPSPAPAPAPRAPRSAPKQPK